MSSGSRYKRRSPLAEATLPRDSLYVTREKNGRQSLGAKIPRSADKSAWRVTAGPICPVWQARAGCTRNYRSKMRCRLDGCSPARSGQDAISPQATCQATAKPPAKPPASHPPATRQATAAASNHEEIQPNQLFQRVVGGRFQFQQFRCVHNEQPFLFPVFCCLPQTSCRNWGALNCLVWKLECPCPVCKTVLGKT